MIAEFAERYRVRRLSAVFKTANHRSRRLLERLGFGAALPGSSAGIDIDPDESIMVRDAPTAPSAMRPKE